MHITKAIPLNYYLRTTNNYNKGTTENDNTLAESNSEQ